MDHDLEITMSILSNYTPECLVSCMIQCPIQDLSGMGGGLEPLAFAEKFRDAVNIAIMIRSGPLLIIKVYLMAIDAVVIATGNDYRAVEAAGHAYASREGAYSALSRCDLSGGMFQYELQLPMAIGTVGGLTNTHPLARLSMDLLRISRC